MTTDTERLDWVERALLRTGEIYEDEACTKLRAIAKAWVIATQVDEGIREAIDRLMIDGACPGCGGRHDLQ